MTNNTYTTVASDDVIARTKENLIANGFHAEVVENASEALDFIRNSIPEGAQIMNGSSRTLEQIGFIQLLKDKNHKWQNLHDAILAEADEQKQALLRRQSLLSDYFINSVAALTENGETVTASFSGSQIPSLAATSPNVLIIVGAQKIVPTLADAFERLEKHVIPLEDQRLMEASNIHTTHAKTLILRKESPMMGRNVKVVIVKEPLGF